MSCILAIGAKTKDGYVKVFVNNKRELAHRVAYAKANRVSLTSIAEKVVRHTCDNPKCVNPGHLILGTQSDNIRDCITRNVNSPNRPKFNPQQVEDIRKDCGTLATLAGKYGTSISVISNILNHKGAYK